MVPGALNTVLTVMVDKYSPELYSPALPLMILLLLVEWDSSSACKMESCNTEIQTAFVEILSET